MQINLIAQGKNDPPALAKLARQGVIDLSNVETMTFCLIEGGMQNGDPSVIMVVLDTASGFPVLTQTSLDKLLAAAVGLKATAETRFGWVQQEGVFSMIPPDEATKRMLLEALKKELEG